jgi:hypothetical protein
LKYLRKDDRPPTDFELLREIYDSHRADFLSSVPNANKGRAVLVAVDLAAVAHRLGVDVNSVFGRLYYHLDPKYAPPQADPKSPRKVLFTPAAGDDRNCVNFPLLEAVLAGLWQQRRRDLSAVAISALSLGVAAASLLVSLLR